ncbi:FtsK/SpoIIIE domain-containing protein [Micromonospora sp. NPDC005163]
MAGTLTYILQVAHTFQRKFDPESLQAALADCHLYVISRRPSVRIDRTSPRIHLDRLSVDFMTREDMKGEPERIPVAIDLHELDTISDFRTYAHGSYFSMAMGGGLVHGDAWSLASMMSGADEKMARQEVLYVGQAFGDDGSTNVVQRTRRHEKLQRVYETHAGGDWDIFVSALRITEILREADDHINDDEPGSIGMEGFYGVFQDARKPRILKASVDLVEHGLIAYFNPPYNEKLVEWRAGQPTSDMKKLRNAGFRLLRLHLSSHGSLARFYSREVPSPTRSHLVVHDLPPTPDDSVVRGISAPCVGDWRSHHFLSEERDALLTGSEAADLVMNVFGPEAPQIRVPEEVEGPIEHLNAKTSAAFKRWADEAPEPLKYEGPEFVHETGSVPVGIDDQDNKIYWQLHKPGLGLVHGLIVGPRGTGKTNFLNVLRLGALKSGKLALFSADPSGRNTPKDVASMAGCAVAEGIPEIIVMLRSMEKELDRRMAMGGNADPTAEKPGLIVTLEDAHLVLSVSEQAVQHAEKIARWGPENGVSLIFTLPDVNVQRFGGSFALRQELALRGRVMLYGEPGSINMLDEFGEDLRDKLINL